MALIIVGRREAGIVLSLCRNHACNSSFLPRFSARADPLVAEGKGENRERRFISIQVLQVELFANLIRRTFSSFAN